VARTINEKKANKVVGGNPWTPRRPGAADGATSGSTRSRQLGEAFIIFTETKLAESNVPKMFGKHGHRVRAQGSRPFPSISDSLDRPRNLGA
jgi:hypothetical protein